MWLYHSLVNEPVYQTGYLGSNPSSHLKDYYGGGYVAIK